jgi:hypothetical protein
VHFDGTSVIGLSVGDLATETEADGAVRVYYSHRDSRRLVSAIDVLEGKADPDKLAAKLVVIGVTALVLLDYQLTPLREWMPGSEIHVQLLENIFDGTLLVRPRWAPLAEVAGFALLGALLIWVTPLWRPGAAAAMASACIALPLAGAYAAFRMERWLFDAATPALGLMLMFGLLLVLTLAEASRQRKALQRVVQGSGASRVRRRRDAGSAPHSDRSCRAPTPCWRDLHHLAASRRRRKWWRRPYDSSARWRPPFFLIGDVAAIPASIFMAVSKAYNTRCCARPGTASAHDGGQRRIPRDNSESLFVTASRRSSTLHPASSPTATPATRIRGCACHPTLPWGSSRTAAGRRCARSTISSTRTRATPCVPASGWSWSPTGSPKRRTPRPSSTAFPGSKRCSRG